MRRVIFPRTNACSLRAAASTNRMRTGAGAFKCLYERMKSGLRATAFDVVASSMRGIFRTKMVGTRTTPSATLSSSVSTDMDAGGSLVTCEDCATESDCSAIGEVLMSAAHTHELRPFQFVCYATVLVPTRAKPVQAFVVCVCAS